MVISAEKKETFCDYVATKIKPISFLKYKKKEIRSTKRTFTLVNLCLTKKNVYCRRQLIFIYLSCLSCLTVLNILNIIDHISVLWRLSWIFGYGKKVKWWTDFCCCFFFLQIPIDWKSVKFNVWKETVKDFKEKVWVTEIEDLNDITAQNLKKRLFAVSINPLICV